MINNRGVRRLNAKSLFNTTTITGFIYGRQMDFMIKGKSFFIFLKKEK
jgi:hypothetical protein